MFNIDVYYKKKFYKILSQKKLIREQTILVENKINVWFIQIE